LLLSILLNVYLGFEYTLSHRYPWGHTVYGLGERPVATFYYRPLSSHPHSSVGFKKDGTKEFEWFDDDEDGWNDRSHDYSAGRLVATWRDSDEDGSFDSGEVLRPNGEIASRHVDSDSDSYPETVECYSSDGVVRLDTITCRLLIDATKAGDSPATREADD
jgi:hypothetical protein